MSRNEHFRWGQAHYLAKWWDPNMGTPESLVEREGPYIGKLAASSARDLPITIKKRQDGSRVIWDGHHRVAAHMFFDTAGNKKTSPRARFMKYREID